MVASSLSCTVKLNKSFVVKQKLDEKECDSGVISDLDTYLKLSPLAKKLKRYNSAHCI